MALARASTPGRSPCSAAASSARSRRRSARRPWPSAWPQPWRRPTCWCRRSGNRARSCGEASPWWSCSCTGVATSGAATSPDPVRTSPSRSRSVPRRRTRQGWRWPSSSVVSPVSPCASWATGRPPRATSPRRSTWPASVGCRSCSSSTTTSGPSRCPGRPQTAAVTLAQKAIAAGIDGEQVDGNDVVAVRDRVGTAVERAREGGGATLVEAVTYRLADHTTADDAGRYRDEAEVSAHWEHEPLSPSGCSWWNGAGGTPTTRSTCWPSAATVSRPRCGSIWPSPPCRPRRCSTTCTPPCPGPLSPSATRWHVASPDPTAAADDDG